MFDWINGLSAWMQSWLSHGSGLAGLFVSAFASATVLPGSSEVVMTALVTAYPDLAWRAFGVAVAGNVLGCLLTFGMGHASREGYERFQRVRHGVQNQHVQRLRRYGPPALLLSFVPLVGDAVVLAAGWLKLPFWQSMAWVAAGKAARYLLLLAALLGILSFA